ncbi:MAG: methyltransferase domain-containing protein [Spirochaetaceae bacterium]|jgi:2-polyprenyl-3-methyl-5-hydroxy-6-metoxy-1,4-benzoquinol methylase|nr:methyltransferase domain-containing protein [Spirochaetaceae bacterium]
MNGTKTFLVVPACESGRGGGHLFRSAALVSALRCGGGKAWLFTSTPLPAAFSPDLAFPGDPASVKDWSLIVLDRFRTPRNEIERWSALAPVLGIDEGCSRDICDFLIDLLPWPGKGKPNLCAPSLLPLPQNRRPAFPFIDREAAAPGTIKVLVSFGAEDPAGLTVKAVKYLNKIFFRLPAQAGGIMRNFTEGIIKTATTAVLGPLRKNNKRDRVLLEQAGITVIDAALPETAFDFQERLADYDLFVTHFGLSAFEALYARIPVLLFNPSPYHERLTGYAGLPSIRAVKGHFRAGIAPAYKTISVQSIASAYRWGLEEKTRRTMAELLLNAAPKVYRACPLCGAPAEFHDGKRAVKRRVPRRFDTLTRGKMSAAGRFPGRSYRLCSCGTFLMARLDPPPVEYNRNYFFAEYKKQYGKTYLEDFPQLKEAAERRLTLICALQNSGIHNHGAGGEALNNVTASVKLRGKERLRKYQQGNTGKRVLDIGCAYGPFLAAARDRGFEAAGLDPAPEAAAYVRESLGITALQGTFPESAGELERLGGGPEQFDVITLWYVIEHFEEPGKALAVINGLLKIGGILAFSTPSAAGISCRKSLRAFLERSPADHWTIWNPFRSAAILKRYGFTLKKTVITGHHPERFPNLSAVRPSGLLWFVTLALSRVFALGDTFEVYAVKTAGANHA